MGERSRTAGSAAAGTRSGLRVPFENIARHRCMIMDNQRRLKIPACDRSDVMQEILLSAWRTVETGGFHASECRSVGESVRRWLYVVTWHHTTHYRERQHQWEKGRDSRVCSAINDVVLPPFEQVEARLCLRRLERIDPALRDVVADSALGYTAEEIAAERGQNPSTIQHRVERGREQLRRMLRSKNAPAPLAIRGMLASMPPLP
ncbi:ECF family RNA polymerase sigma factor [Sorangium cellulosum]|uniref:ECF family RNA polymerase sigma factor n=1 Tax=Sorangium cellulosum TaxID=56 RepID=A0A4V0NCZ8_SORCE|nr:sigma-70 family RNA polymerase sigma factor [Sorangium cellulosum]AUX20922.1 ECF family RNA polymerase sigma factor [Sorangium cellulosum]